MAYAHRPTIYDADSHLMEGLDWLRDRADAATRELLPDLTAVLDRGGAGAGSAIQKGEARMADPVRTAELAQDVIASAKGWLALGAMDGGERSQALDLLGFTVVPDRRRRWIVDLRWRIPRWRFGSNECRCH